MRRLQDFPYHSQRNNKYNPSGACNVTSIAMCLNYHGVDPVPEKQLEDELYQYMIDNKKSRHSGWHLAWAAENFPKHVGSDVVIKDVFKENGTLDELKQAIAEGNPCVVHGFFTKFGHIVAISGYDDKGVFIEDPWGEWHSWGYDNSPGTGQYHLSWATFNRLVSPESPANPRHIFLHVISATKVVSAPVEEEVEVPLNVTPLKKSRKNFKNAA